MNKPNRRAILKTTREILRRSAHLMRPEDREWLEATIRSLLDAAEGHGPDKKIAPPADDGLGPPCDLCGAYLRWLIALTPRDKPIPIVDAWQGVIALKHGPKGATHNTDPEWSRALERAEALGAIGVRGLRLFAGMRLQALQENLPATMTERATAWHQLRLSPQ